MILINSVIFFFSKIYCRNSCTNTFLKNNDYTSYFISKNYNSTIQLFNNSLSSNEDYYYDTQEHICKKNINSTINGYDTRNNFNNEISIYDISLLLYKKKLLDILCDNETSVYYKMIYIEKHNKIYNENKCNNLYAGGLMNDWYS